MSDMSFTDALLAINRAAKLDRPATVAQTRKIEASQDEIKVEAKGLPDQVEASKVQDFLVEKGYNPEEWAVKSFRTSEWTMPNGELGESVRYTFERVAPEGERVELGVDELEAIVAKAEGRDAQPLAMTNAFVVALGDMQFGKAPDGNIEETVERCLTLIREAARWAYGAPHIHVAWLGDHIEGFTSQGGANAWRTQLTLTEQTRLVRRVMMYAVEKFAPIAERLTMVAVPGNHGEPQRFSGKGVTRYDDSHDTEALIAVAEACKLNPEAFGHVEFYTPDTDEMTVVLEVGGATIAHAHGHQWKPGKHWEWWKGQAFGKAVDLQHCDVLLAGHLHHFHAEENGKRLFVQVPALESGSAWWRHSTGEVGNPGIVCMTVAAGKVDRLGVIR